MEHSPKSGTLLGSATARAAVPYDQVKQHINASDARRLIGVGSEPSVIVGATPDESMVWMHGGFWYQGEYVFESADAAQTAVTYRIRNISGLPDRFIRVWQRAQLRSQQDVVDRFAAGLPGRVES
ncbi:hypothetical protein [Aeromicrobium ginsengisoli]|uniref:SRPBCC family protein n=1 Tax=Aeromicrobium ginsengisoli TaxID=363867 RepID=A0A5M4FH73_9ACTN|nr:hypothetical protein [Aeromicrobium ginsengisoli]KAA1399589.1 hypothetical protein ESP70_002150 [Aeromicrobium ginsengisoli]